MGRRKEFNEQEVLEQALMVFWRKGYEKTSMDDLTEAMGIQRKSLYNTFDDKQNLYDLSLKLYRQQMKNKFAQAIKNNQSVKEQLQGIFKIAYLENEKGCFVVNTAIELSQSNPELKIETNTVFSDIKELFQSLIVVGQQTGEISQERNAAFFANLLLNTLISARVLLKTGEELSHVEMTINQTINLLY